MKYQIGYLDVVGEFTNQYTDLIDLSGRRKKVS